jgi:hypothetical protein
MPQGSEYLLLALGIMIILFMCFSFFILKSVSRDKKNRLRKELLIELRDKDPDIEPTILFDIINRTIL